MRKSRIEFYIPSTSPSPTKRIPGIALGKGGRYRPATKSCVSPRIRICGWVKRSRWNSRGPGPWTTGLTSTSGFGIVVRSARGEVEVRITADEFRFSAPAPVIRRSHSQPIPPTLSVMTLANISAPGSQGTQKRKSFCASRSLPSATSLVAGDAVIGVNGVARAPRLVVIEVLGQLAVASRRERILWTRRSTSDRIRAIASRAVAVGGTSDVVPAFRNPVSPPHRVAAGKRGNSYFSLREVQRNPPPIVGL